MNAKSNTSNPVLPRPASATNSAPFGVWVSAVTVAVKLKQCGVNDNVARAIPGTVVVDDTVVVKDSVVVVVAASVEVAAGSVDVVVDSSVDGGTRPPTRPLPQ